MRSSGRVEVAAVIEGSGGGGGRAGGQAGGLPVVVPVRGCGGSLAQGGDAGAVAGDAAGALDRGGSPVRCPPPPPGPGPAPDDGCCPRWTVRRSPAGSLKTPRAGDRGPDRAVSECGQP